VYKFIIPVFMFIGLSATAQTPLVFDYADYTASYDKKFLAENPHQLHAIEREGQTIHAREFGSPSNTKAPVIAAHGFPDNLHLYDAIVPYIAPERRMITFDFLGWGKSDKPAAARDAANPTANEHVYNALSLYKDLEAVIDYFGDEKVVLVAHDLSAFPIIDWAIANPERVEKLVILNSVYFRSEALLPPKGIFLFGSAEAQYSREYLVTIASKYPAYFQAMVEEQLHRFYSNSEARERYTPLFVELSKDIRPAFFQMNDALVPEITERTKQLMQGGGTLNFDGPVTVVFGTDDPYLTEALSKEFGSAFPNSTLRNIDGAGHYVQLDNPELTSKYILEGLE
jgi:haloalkane dehalogenase